MARKAAPARSDREALDLERFEPFMINSLTRRFNGQLEKAFRRKRLTSHDWRLLATLANTVNQSTADYGDTVTNLKTMLQAWQSNDDEFTGLLGKLPEFGDAINRSSSYGGFVSLYLCNFTIKIARHEANIFGRRHSEVCL